MINYFYKYGFLTLLVFLLFSEEVYSQDFLGRAQDVVPDTFTGNAAHEQNYKAVRTRADTTGGLHMSVKKKWEVFRGSDIDEKCSQFKITKPRKKDKADIDLVNSYTDDLCEKLINEITDETYDRGSASRGDNLGNLYDSFEFDTVMDASNASANTVSCLEVYKKFLSDVQSTFVWNTSSPIPGVSPSQPMTAYKPVIDKCKSYCKGVAESNYESRTICGIEYTTPPSEYPTGSSDTPDPASTTYEDCQEILSNAENAYTEDDCLDVCNVLYVSGNVFLDGTQFSECQNRCNAKCSEAGCISACNSNAYCISLSTIEEREECIEACEKGCNSSTISQCVSATSDYCGEVCDTNFSSDEPNLRRCYKECGRAHNPDTSGSKFQEFKNKKLDEKPYCYYYLNQWVSKDGVNNGNPSDADRYIAAIDNTVFDGSYIWYCFDTWYSNKSFRTPYCCQYIDYMFFYDSSESDEYYCHCTYEWSGEFDAPVKALGTGPTTGPDCSLYGY